METKEPQALKFQLLCNRKAEEEEVFCPPPHCEDEKIHLSEASEKLKD
jgi:hypothetical protein